MDDPTRRFLNRQYEKALEFAAQSDLVEISPIGPPPVQRYAVRLRTRGLVKSPSGAIVPTEGCTFGIWMPNDYLRRVSPFEIVQWDEPRNVFHPNVGPGPGGEIYICLGNIVPSTEVVDLIEQTHEIFGWVNRMTTESKAINHEACQWARSNGDQLPTDARPLRRGIASVDLSDLQVEEIATS
jgi:hypothetical protein